ncbi:MAG: hypothetical protein H6591_11560 [Flavobacteriales bacterium]|nr:hypothetical protein [Flavobacteriales bacterium]
MKTILFPAALILMGTLSAAAQSGTAVVPKANEVAMATVAPGGDDCVSRTTPEAWTSLGLTADQMTKVQEIQTKHKKECAAMTDKKATSDMMDKHSSEIKEVLSTDQYTKWMNWCEQRAQGTAKPESK